MSNEREKAICRKVSQGLLSEIVGSNENNVCNIHSCIDNATSLYFVMKNLTCQISFDFFLYEFFSAFFFTCRIACSRVAGHVLSLYSGLFVLPVQAKNSLCCHGFI